MDAQLFGGNEVFLVLVIKSKIAQSVEADAVTQSRMAGHWTGVGF